jgi:putative transposase
MEQEKAAHHVATLGRVLGVSPSGYYAWCDRPPSAHAQADQVLLAQIRVSHEESRGTYGAPRVHADLQAQGIRCGRKRIARLMREADLAGAQRRRYRGTTRQAREAIVAPDLVQRDFTASARDQLWVADITYVPTTEGWLYLATVLDAWSRRIVGWAMADMLQTDLVAEALTMAVWNRRPTVGVVHHSDRGAQYVSFRQACMI